MKRYIDIIQKFSSKKIAVIGDIMLDKYLMGDVDRISPEAPVPVVSIKNEKYVLGGAGNVAANISALGGKAFLFGVIGFDSSGEKVFELAEKAGVDRTGIIKKKNKQTIQKIRIVSQGQQLVRIDYDENQYIDTYIKGQFVNILENHQDLDGIMISDYAKGTITNDFCDLVKDYANMRDIPIIVDPKPLHKDFYASMTVIKPNKKEAEEMCGKKIKTQEDILYAGREIQNTLKSNVVLTNGEKGITIFEKNRKAVHIPTHAHEVFDVSGAGDSVAANLILALCSGASLVDSAAIANIAAGIKVGKSGTAPVFSDEIINNIVKYHIK